MKHIFIINPAAGTGQSEKNLLPQILRFIKNHGEDFEIHRTMNKQEVASYVSARASLGDPVRFYAVGGDGTICDVVNGIAEHGNAELAVIPCGSGNDFVRNFTHKSNFLNLDRQLEGTVEYIDVIKYNNSYCMNMLNIGTDCEIVVRSGQLRGEKKMKGSVSYAAAALELLPKGLTYDLEYTDADGQLKREDFMLVAIGNGRFCGGGFKSCPSASLTDGKMDIGLVRICKGPTLFKMLAKYRMGTHLKDKDAEKICKYMQLSEFTLIPHSDANVSVDGEVEKCVRMDCRVIPRAVKVVIPKGSKLID